MNLVLLLPDVARTTSFHRHSYDGPDRCNNDNDRLEIEEPLDLVWSAMSQRLPKHKDTNEGR